MTRNIVLFMLCLFLCFLPAVVGGVISSSNINMWYDFLVKPPFTPPNWIFGPVWTVLYLLMAVIMYILIKSDIPGSSKKNLLLFFGGQMALNFFWTPVFFGMHAPFFALCILILMIALCFDFVREARRIMPALSYLMYPYMIWLFYAGYLNGGVYVLN